MVSYSICLVLAAVFLGAQGYLASESASAIHQFKTNDPATYRTAIKFAPLGLIEMLECMAKSGNMLECLIVSNHLLPPFLQNYRYCGLEAEAEELASPINALDAACREHGQGQALADKAMSLARQVETVDDEQRQAACVVSILADLNSDQDLSLAYLFEKADYCMNHSKLGLSLDVILEKIRDYIIKNLEPSFSITNMKLSHVKGTFDMILDFLRGLLCKNSSY